MDHNNSNVRRQDRLLDKDKSFEVLDSGEYGFLSMVEIIDKKVGAYGIPLSYAWDGNESIYFHCAKEGHKLDCLADNNQVSFCVVGKTQVLPKQFSTAYSSVLVRGLISTELCVEERKKGLLLLVDKYSPQFKQESEKYIDKLFDRTMVLRLDIKNISGKSKALHRD